MAMLIDDESKEFFLKAGKIAGKALLYGAKTIKVGLPVREFLDKVEIKIFDLGGSPAFPAQASINDVAAHFCPNINDDIEFKEEDIVKIDFGAEYNGFIGDNAKTIYFGKDPEIIKLVEASKKALLEASKLVKIGTKVSEIGEVIESTINSFGFNPIRNLSGHGLGVYAQHDAPSIPNFNNGDPSELEENEMIAIEPFATMGAGMVKAHGEATLFNRESNKNTRNPFSREALKIINKFEGLPFSSKDIEKELGPGKTRIALNSLIKEEIINEFPPLQERSNGLVSQHEHSFLVGKKSIITTLIDDE